MTRLDVEPPPLKLTEEISGRSAKPPAAGGCFSCNLSKVSCDGWASVSSEHCHLKQCVYWWVVLAVLKVSMCFNSDNWSHAVAFSTMLGDRQNRSNPTVTADQLHAAMLGRETVWPNEKRTPGEASRVWNVFERTTEDKMYDRCTGQRARLRRRSVAIAEGGKNLATQDV